MKFILVKLRSRHFGQRAEMSNIWVKRCVCAISIRMYHSIRKKERYIDR